MGLRRFSWMLLWMGIGMILAGWLLVGIIAWCRQPDVIGGADWPTFQFIYRNALAGLPALLVQWGVPFAIVGAASLIWGADVRAACTVRTSLLSMGLSATGAVGLYCFINWLAMAAFHERHLYPRAYPFYVSVGLIALCVFLLLLVLYGMSRSKNRSVKGVSFDIVTAVLFLSPFSYTVSFAQQLVRNIIK